MSEQTKAERLAGYWAAKNDQGEYLYSSLRFREETAAELRRLSALNGELLEALKQALEECIWPNERLSDVYDKALAAIARAEEKV
jgi:septal ring factor EnvC (AmiA/AmiB activator)